MENKDKIIAGVLALLLGAFGAHKFYMGNTKAGVIYLLVSLLSCGTLATIAGILALIEGIMILVEDDEKFAARVEAKSLFL